MAEVVLQAKGLSKSYGRGPAAVRVLRGLDVSLEAGKLTALLGPSGSGKSTLLHLLGLMDTPDSGEIFFAGRPAGALSEEGKAALRNRRLGFMFQFDSLLPEFTVLENVLMPARIAVAQTALSGLGQARQKAEELLSRFNLKGLSHRLPSQLSGGERQRAALCRALVNEPAAVLADEPTGNLDKHSGELVFKDLGDLARQRGVAVLLVSHNEAVSQFADVVLRMADGTLLEHSEKP
ncbi:MAG: ABC transporter ATP-binding protein [Elusimicrobia bacterium]|nr:ABC transporter ATP-binding protein [Elusimicrobiota bacterium]